MKKALSILMAVLICVSLAVPALAAGLPFTDVPENAWYYDAVKYVYDRGIMNGQGNSKFGPDGVTTRGQVMTILARLDGVDTSGSSPWYKVGMDWAKAQDISDGARPEGQITREELATMLWRYADEPACAEVPTHADASKVSGWAKTAMNWAVKTGIVTGSNNKLDPQGSAVRAQVATMIMRFCKYINDEPGTPDTQEGINWKIENKVLTISGKGEIPNYNRVDYGNNLYGNDSPWGDSGYDKVIIKDGITVIGANAFYGGEMTEIIIPDTVTEIGYCALSSAITHVTVPGSVKTLVNGAFYLCTDLKDIVLCEGIETIGDQVFMYTESLESITIPASVTYIGPHCFEGSAVSSVTLLCKDLADPDIVIADLLEDAPNLTEITLAGSQSDWADKLAPVAADLAASGVSVKYSSDEAEGISWSIKNDILFITGKGPMPDYDSDRYSDGTTAPWGSTGYSKVIIADGVTSVGAYAFYGTQSLKEAVIPGSVKTIGECAFNFSRINKVTLGEGVESLGRGAFADCLLTSITIPASVTSIAPLEFSGSANIRSIYILCDNIYVEPGVTLIDDILYCTNVKDIYLAGSQADWADDIAPFAGQIAERGVTVHYNYTA